MVALQVWLLLGLLTAILGWWRSPVDAPDDVQPSWWVLLTVALTWPFWLWLWWVNSRR